MNATKEHRVADNHPARVEYIVPEVNIFETKDALRKVPQKITA